MYSIQYVRSWAPCTSCQITMDYRLTNILLIYLSNGKSMIGLKIVRLLNTFSFADSNCWTIRYKILTRSGHMQLCFCSQSQFHSVKEAFLQPLICNFLKRCCCPITYLQFSNHIFFSSMQIPVHNFLKKYSLQQLYSIPQSIAEVRNKKGTGSRSALSDSQIGPHLCNSQLELDLVGSEVINYDNL
jgi:hypothetical protein